MGNLVYNKAVEDAGIYPSELERTDIKLYDSHVYLVFSKDVSDKEVKLWTNALEEVKRTTYRKIYDKYIK